MLVLMILIYKYDRKEILMNNPDKGTQTDLFETEKAKV